VAENLHQDSTSADEWLNVFSTIANLPQVSKTPMPETDQPLVTVVIVHSTRHVLLQQAIESIESQFYTNIELIVVDDGSTDPESIKYLNELSWKWWESKGWRVIPQQNRYLGAARNVGGNVFEFQSFFFSLICIFSLYSDIYYIQSLLFV